MFDDHADSRSGNKSVAGSSSPSTAGMVANASSDAMATEGKSHHPPPTPPLDDRKDKKSFVHKINGSMTFFYHIFFY